MVAATRGDVEGQQIRFADRRQWMLLYTLLHHYDPCDAPATPKPAKPRPEPVVALNGASEAIRVIVREEITAALASLRPAIREEALAAVREAFEPGARQ
jgi:hypothetical protein